MTTKRDRSLRVFALGLMVSAAACGKAPGTSLKGEPSLSVMTVSGEIRGVSEPGIRVFRGIPYAAPPVGPLRWRPPRPAEPWEGVRPAEDFGDSCPQLQTTRPMSEDCLFLNIWTPAGVTSASRVPVLVYIHGGGFRSGSGAEPVSHGDVFAREGVVMVTLNYRLGALGFLTHPLLETEQAGEPRADYGLLDMVAALGWVKGNIQAFGGDPSNVTLFGHSAGGMAVQLLMVVPQAEGLFERAISMSGYGTWPLPRVSAAQSDVAPRGAPSAEEIGARILEGAADGADIESVAGLRTIPAARLAKAVGGLHLPVVDGVLVPDEPGIVFSRGDQHDVPFISGGTSFDGTIFQHSGVTLESFLESWGPRLPEVRTLYAADFAVSDDLGASRLFGDNRYLIAARTLVRDMARVSSPGRVYYYTFVPEARRSEVPGAGHGAETEPLFGHVDDEGSRGVGKIMREYWISFARDGDPNGPGLPEWPEHDAASDQWLVVDETSVAKPGVKKERLDFLERQYLARVSRAAS